MVSAFVTARPCANAAKARVTEVLFHRCAAFFFGDQGAACCPLAGAASANSCAAFFFGDQGAAERVQVLLR